MHFERKHGWRLDQTPSTFLTFLLLIVTGLSLLGNLGLLVVVIRQVAVIRDTARDAMDSILAGADPNAAAYLSTMRERALEKVRREPQERERRAYN